MMVYTIKKLYIKQSTAFFITLLVLFIFMLFCLESIRNTTTEKEHDIVLSWNYNTNRNKI